jgi:hypothetical protein
MMSGPNFVVANSTSASIESRGGKIDSDRTGARCGSAQRRVAGAARDVEDVLARLDAEVADDAFPDRPQLPFRNRGVITRRPRRARVLLELLEGTLIVRFVGIIGVHEAETTEPPPPPHEENPSFFDQLAVSVPWLSPGK